MNGYVLRFRCNTSGETHDVPMELTDHERNLLREVSERVRVSTGWDFQMEILADTQQVSEEQIRMAQDRLRGAVRDGMIAPEEASPYFFDGDI